MIVVHKFVLAELEVMEHLFIQTANGPGSVRLERKEASSAASGNCFKVLQAGIRFVGAHFSNGEALGGFLNKRSELRRIGRVFVQNSNSSHDVRLDPASDVALNPLALLASTSVFFVVPSQEPIRRKARAINREVCFNGTERTSALDNQLLQDRREVRILEKGTDLMAGNRMGDKSGSSLFLVGDFCLFYFESPSISQEKRSFLLEENR